MEGEYKKIKNKEDCMIRFHFVNNEKLDNDISVLCDKYNCNGISKLINQVLFRDQLELLVFINHYCSENRNFKTVKGCRINRKVSIPEVVYHGMKLCHKELNTFSIAFIWRSLLIDIIECLKNGGLKAWENYKRHVIEIGENNENDKRVVNTNFLDNIKSVHMPQLSQQNISKVVFFNFGNEYLGYLRC